MANDETPAGFLSRWSRRKTEVRQGVALDDVGISSAEPSKEPVKNLGSDLQELEGNSSASQKPVPSMADVQNLTQDSDFTQFMASEVAPEVKNAAMKKLFADPHFNVMDRMDVYIDDYSQPDPIPQAMLRQLASAKFLNLFEEDEDAKKEAHAAVSDIPQANGSQVVAQSDPVPPISNSQSSKHDHPDLRLQPDPATRPESAGPKPV
jgi:Protein of unknown function (DUF3306)